MALQMSTAVRNAILDAIETSVGAAAILKIRTGPPPANCAAPDSGTALATLALPADWMNPAALGIKTKLGVWSELNADATGDAGHFRIYANDGVTCHLQGTVTIVGGGGDLQLLTTVAVLAGSLVVITACTFTEGFA